MNNTTSGVEILLSDTNFGTGDYFQFDIDIPVATTGATSTSGGDRVDLQLVVESYNETSGAWTEILRVPYYLRNPANTNLNRWVTLSTGSRLIPFAKAKRQRFKIEGIAQAGEPVRLGYINNAGTASSVTWGGIDVTIFKSNN